MTKINFTRSKSAIGEAAKGVDRRRERGFWDNYVVDGPFVDVGYSGGDPSAQPIFNEAIGLDVGTPGYNGSDFPFESATLGTIHASHLLEHISDYGKFFREALRTLKPGGTLILTVPLMEAYEHAKVPPSRFNSDHKRFYTASRLLFEIESSLGRSDYRILHLRELFNLTDLTRPLDTHAEGPFYEIELVLQKTTENATYG